MLGNGRVAINGEAALVAVSEIVAEHLKLLMDDPDAPLFLEESAEDKPYFEMLEGLISALRNVNM